MDPTAARERASRVVDAILSKTGQVVEGTIPDVVEQIAEQITVDPAFRSTVAAFLEVSAIENPSHEQALEWTGLKGEIFTKFGLRRADDGGLKGIVVEKRLPQ